MPQQNENPMSPKERNGEKKENKKGKEKSRESAKNSLGFALCLAFSVAVVFLFYFLRQAQLAPPPVSTEGGEYYATQEITEPGYIEGDDRIWPVIQNPQFESAENLPKIRDTKKVLNILLIGTDARDKKSYALADTMILLSVNTETKKITAASFLRDILVHMEGSIETQVDGEVLEHQIDTNNRLNTAFAYGGPKLLLSTLKNSFGIDVKYYAAVDFFSFISVVDALGGLPVYVTAGEIEVMNSYIAEVNTLLGENAASDQLPPISGAFTLNGKQALGYVRDRDTEMSDFARTEKQRKILSLMLEKLKNMSLSQISEFLDLCLPLVTTNLESDVLAGLIRNVPSYLSYGFEETVIPQPKLYRNVEYSGMKVLEINAKENMEYLYELIYGKPAA